MEKSFQERVAEAQAKVASISAEQAYETQKQYPEVVFIDPRNTSDIKTTTGIIPNALNVDINTLSSDTNLPTELADRSTPIITACQAGPMGALAAYALKQNGYKNVSYIAGGTQAWLDEGYTTIR